MGMFKMEKPRRFNHQYIYVDERKEKLQKLEEKEVPVLERLRQALEQYGQLQSHLKEAQRLEIHRQQAADSYRKADLSYRQQAQRYETLYQEYLAGQAGILASGLQDNYPCPVCGSLHHPAPAERFPRI